MLSALWLSVEWQTDMTLWLVRPPHGFKPYERLNMSEMPCPTILASGDPGAFAYYLEDDGRMPASLPCQAKPRYVVPSMATIAALPWNGFRVASLFSGCGGSSLGYKMAGFRVIWANEFIPAAQEVYRLNHPTTLLDSRDIRQVQPQDILAALAMRPGELDLLDGSPPCASFSTAGKRAKSWGKVKAYSETKQRTDDLFWEYARVLKGLQPKVFVAENVSGLVKGVAKGYFLEILRLLKDCGYQVACRLLDAQWLGVPQMRQRTIFIGVRQDLGLAPAFPQPLPYRYSVREALPWMLSDEETTLQVEEANGLNSQDLGQHRLLDVTDKPMPTIQAQRPVQVAPGRAYRDRRGAFGHDGDITEQPAPTVLADSVGTHWIEPETDISRYAIGRLWDEVRPGEAHAKRFSLVKPALDGPYNTIDTGGHGAYSPTGKLSRATVVHPLEKRKFTIAELKRICAFPDDFQLTGSYAQQWERLGRAVPPVMMYHIAAVIRDELFAKIP